MGKSVINFLIISGDNKHSEFMQVCDVFEESKVLGTIQNITFSLEEGILADMDRVRKILNSSPLIFQSSGQRLSFMHFVSYTNNNIVTYNDGYIIPYVDKEVRCISDGTKFFMLDDFIRLSTNFKVITDEYRFIQAIGLDAEIAKLIISDETKSD